MGCSNAVKDELQAQKELAKRVVNSTNMDIRKNYEFISILGNGSFGKVRLYRDKHYKELLFAIKTLKKEGIPEYQFNLLKSEVSILSDLDHPNIVKYFGTFEDEFHVHILMEYLKGHNLFKIISLKKYTGFDEKDMSRIIDQLLKALVFIHSKNIVHRDIKPENILFENKKDYSTLKLIDFGLACGGESNDHKSAGTPFYMAPEAFKGESCAKSDIWSVGVIVYLMLTGKFPFDIGVNENDNNLFHNIQKENYDTTLLDDSECSEEAKDFIFKCLQKKTDDRICTKDALSHPWILKFSNKTDTTLLNEDALCILLDFANKNALQKEIYYFLAKVSKESEIGKLKHYFNQIDVNNTGFLTMEDIKAAFEKAGVKMDKDEMNQVWDGLDFHKVGKIHYSEFLAAMISTYKFEKEEKLISVFNLMKENTKKEVDFITADSLLKAIKALNLNIDEEEIKECFKEKELYFEDFKNLILEPEKISKLKIESCTNLMVFNNNSKKEYQRNLNKHKTH